MSVSTCILVGIVGYIIGAGSILALGFYYNAKEKRGRK